MHNNETQKEYIRAGLMVKIYQDETAQSPDDWGDDGVFLVNYHRDFTIERERIINEDGVRAWYQGGKIEQAEKYHIFALSMLSHSGVWLSLNRSFVSDAGGWDTSHVGIVLVSKETARTRAQAAKAAANLVELWNKCNTGDVYGYVIEDADGNNLESCWGFYGMEEVEAEANAAAEGEAKRITLKHIQKKRAEIKNHVPLGKRSTLSTMLKQ